MISKHYSMICAEDGSIKFASGSTTDHQISYVLHLLLRILHACKVWTSPQDGTE